MADLSYSNGIDSLIPTTSLIPQESAPITYLNSIIASLLIQLTSLQMEMDLWICNFQSEYYRLKVDNLLDPLAELHKHSLYFAELGLVDNKFV